MLRLHHQKDILVKHHVNQMECSCSEKEPNWLNTTYKNQFTQKTADIQHCLITLLVVVPEDKNNKGVNRHYRTTSENWVHVIKIEAFVKILMAEKAD